jgi:alpha-1,2-mannosyltransferase
VKLVPGIFIVYLLLTKRLRAAAVSAGVFLATVGTGFALLPKQSLVFWSGNVAEPERITGNGSADAAENQSIRGVIAKIVDDPDLATMKWLPVAVAIGVLAMLAAVLASRRGSEFLAVCVVGATGVLVTPLAWSHYWVWFVPVLVLGLHLAWTGRRRWAWPATVLGYLLLFSWPLAFNKGAPFPGLIFVKNGLLQTLEVGLGLLVVIAAAIYVLRKPRAEAGTEPPRLL